MTKAILICSFAFLWTHCSFGQQIIFEGIYTGRKIYIKNPGASRKANCVEKVEVNNKNVPFKNISGFEVKLDSLGFNIGDSVKITITHKADCKPSLLIDNATPVTFNIKSLSLDTSGLLKWEAKEKNNKNPFIIQQYINYQWTKIGEVQSKGDMKENEYSFKIATELKDYEFRLMQVDKLGKTKLSKSIKVSSSH
jgi:hypothetical protein